MRTGSGSQYRIETLSGRTFAHARYLHSARKAKRACEREYARCKIRDIARGGFIDFAGYSKHNRKARRTRRASKRS